MLLLCALVVGSGSVWATDLITWTARTAADGSDTYTTGYTYSTNMISGKAGYVQDSGTKNETIVSIALYKTDAALFATTPVEINLSAKLGGGSTKDPLDYNIYACFVDNTGADIEDTEVSLTTKITATTGSDFTVAMPTAYATSAYGIKIYHKKEDGWNARYYNFTLSYSNVATATWALSPASATVAAGESTVLDLTTNYDGTLSFESDDTDIATVSYDSSTKKITVNGIAVGTTTINVTGAVTANYKAIDKTISVIVQKSLAANCIMYESFDSNDATGGNDGTWSGLSGTPAPTFDLTGWTYNTAYAASKCVRIGKNGYFLSPALGVAGDVTLTFKTESWGTDGNNGYVDIVDGGTFDSSESITGVTFAESDTRAQVTLKKSETWTEYTLKIIGVTADSKIKFFGPSNKRVFFDEVEVLLDKVSATFAAGKTMISFSNSFVALDFTDANRPAGLKAYQVTAADASKVTLTEVTSTVAKNTGLVLTGAAGTTYNIPVVESGTDISGTNLLVATDGTSTVSDAAVLSSGAFHPLTSGVIAAGKAYLPYANIDGGNPFAGGAPALGIVFGGETTGIDMVQGAGSKVNGSVFNLNGQRVAQPTKGLYIVNGKKIIIK